MARVDSTINIPLILREASILDAKLFLESEDIGLNSQQQDKILTYFLLETDKFMAELQDKRLSIPSAPPMEREWK